MRIVRNASHEPTSIEIAVPIAEEIRVLESATAKFELSTKYR